MMKGTIQDLLNYFVSRRKGDKKILLFLPAMFFFNISTHTTVVAQTHTHCKKITPGI